MRAKNIVWDLNDDCLEYNIDECDLPEYVDIPRDIAEDEVADYLSNEYGFCVESFDIVADFENLTANELWNIRKQIKLGSIYVSDFNNREGYKAEDISNFFDGYVEYIYELMGEDGADEDAFSSYDNIENLERWFYCYDDLSWVRFEENEESFVSWW